VARRHSSSVSGVAGRKARHTLGTYGALTVDQARKLAQRKLAEAASGRDPSNERAEARKAWSVNQLAEHYEQERIPKLSASTQGNYRRYLRRDILPAIGRKPAAAAEPADILQLFRGAGRRALTVDGDGQVINAGATTANRVLAAASTLFSEAMLRTFARTTPARP